MRLEEVMRIANAGVVQHLGELDVPSVFQLCCETTDGDTVIASAYGTVHARCAAPMIAEAIRSSGREVHRHVTGVVCAICRRSFRYADAVVLVGREGSKSALHVRGCERPHAR